MGHIRDQAELEALRLEVPQLHLQIEEQRARRLAIEEEFAAMEDTWRSREPEIRYVDRYIKRSPYQHPMPNQIIKGPVRYIDGPVRYVDRVVEKPTTIFVHTPRQAGPFGRLGDFLDRVLRLTKV